MPARRSHRHILLFATMLRRLPVAAGASGSLQQRLGPHTTTLRALAAASSSSHGDGGARKAAGSKKLAYEDMLLSNPLPLPRLPIPHLKDTMTR
jgi:hypothetical protein